jgi:hypothetical protein
MASMSGLRIVILSRSARAVDTPAWGLGVDSRLVEQVLREIHAAGKLRIASVDHIDPMSFYGGPRKPRAVDIQIHMEVPCRAAWTWAKVNIVVVNPEWWPRDAWNWVLASKGGADVLVFKSFHARALFPELEEKRVRILSWRADPNVEPKKSGMIVKQRSFLYLIGASANKLAAAKSLLPLWKESWPSVTVVGTSKVIGLLNEVVGVKSNIVLRESFATDTERINEQQRHEFHIVASAAEGFGYTFAEAAMVGALPLWTNIPVYNELYGNVMKDVGRIHCSISGENGPMRDSSCVLILSDIERAVESLLVLSKKDSDRLRKNLMTLATGRIKEFRSGWRTILVPKLVPAEPLTIPPRPLPSGELPEVAIVTLTRNRPRWFTNMARNILMADYPKDKLTWIVVDDSDGLGRIDADIMKFQSKNPGVSVKYISLAKPMALGDKRNKACASAPDSVSVFLMMDDDDHYPAGSVHARVAWLKATGTDCVYCSTLPMYDCGRFISAMNVPPLDLAAEERVSEATLCFKRTFWEARGFPTGVSIAEGEGFLAGRIDSTAEIPPEGIIVSFLHGANATSRRVPESSEANGCHYGFDDEFFLYISELATNQSKPQV